MERDRGKRELYNKAIAVGKGGRGV